MSELFEQLVAHLRGMWRFRWWALLGSWALCLAGFAWVYTLPNQYESSTRVYVDTQTAIKDAVKGIVSVSDVHEEVQKKLSEMLSVPQLKKVARDTDLDLRATTPLELEKLVDALRKNVQISSLKGGTLYSITYHDTDPKMAQRVVQTMLTDFVGDSLRANNADNTEAMRFLEDQIAIYESRLLESEQKLAAFKKKNVGLMPGSEGGYYQNLEAAIGQLASLRSSYRLKQRTREELVKQLEGEEPTFGLVAEANANDGSAPTEFDARIAELRGVMDQLLQRFTEKHPDVIATEAQIAGLEARREEALAVRRQVAPDRVAFNPLDQNPVYQSMRINLINVEVELVELEGSIAEQERKVGRLRQLVDTVPEVEAELSRLNRDYQVTKTYHDDLLNRLESARLGEDANAQSDDIKFQVIDPPVVPLDPKGPNRPLFLTAILLASLMFGLAVSFLLDQLRPVFSTRNELRNKTGLPVLGTIGVVLMPRQKLMTRAQTMMFAVGLLALIGVYFGAVALESRFVDIANSLQNRGST